MTAGSDGRPDLQLKINPGADRRNKKSRPVRLSDIAPDHPTPQTRQAEKLVAACRENVRFLNFNLSKFETHLALPPLADNALYLAYTITVKDTAPFTASDLKHWLHRHGIETLPTFSFVGRSECPNSRISPVGDQTGDNDKTFCIGCHQFLTIPDLEHVIDSFEKFFARLSMGKTDE